MKLRIDFTNSGLNNRECFIIKLGMLETSAFLFHSTYWAEHDCNQFKAVPDLSTLTVLKTISRSHDEAQKSHGKQIHKPMEYTFEYFHFCLVKLIFRRQFCRNPSLGARGLHARFPVSVLS